MSVSPLAATGVGCFVVLIGSSLSYYGNSEPTMGRRSSGADAPFVEFTRPIPAVSAIATETAPRTAEETLRHKLDLLGRGRAFLETLPGYTARFTRQEVVGGELLDEQSIFLKCRHQPFSVYLLWETGDVGQEVLYIDGANHGKLLAHDGGWKARLPALSLAPQGMLAMHDSRYPVTSAGLLGLIEIMTRTHDHDLADNTVATCELNPGCEFDGRECVEFTTHYKNSAVSPVYRKSVTLIDREWNIPLDTRHYEWPSDPKTLTDPGLDEATLIEAYRFSELDLGFQPQDLDFDRTNPEYRFR
jgi:hypothetical protein